MGEEPASFASLVAARSPALLRLAVMLTGSRFEAEDLLQSTLLLACRHADALTTMAAPAAYLRRVMVNEQVSGQRRRRRRPRTTRLPDGFESAARPAASVEDRDAMWSLLARLPRQQRVVLVLRYYEDLPDAEIASLLGLREATVRSHAFRALASLRERLDSPRRPQTGDDHDQGEQRHRSGGRAAAHLRRS